MRGGEGERGRERERERQRETESPVDCLWGTTSARGMEPAAWARALTGDGPKAFGARDDAPTEPPGQGRLLF